MTPDSSVQGHNQNGPSHIEQCSSSQESHDQYPLISPPHAGPKALYPKKYIYKWRTQDGRDVVLRPIHPDDEALERDFLAGLSPATSRNRFFCAIKDVATEMVSHLCHIDYDREMAIVAEHTSNGVKRNVALCQLIQESPNASEYAVVVADDFQNVGLGLKLSEIIMAIGQEKDVKTIYGFVLNDNDRMLRLARRLGFARTRVSEEESRIVLKLADHRCRLDQRPDISYCKVLVVDDHSIVREGIRALLGLRQDIDVVGEAGDGNQALALVHELDPDVVIMDIALPGMDGLEASRLITRQFPRVKTIILSQHDEKEFIIQAIKAGAKGYLPKRALGAELLSAIRVVQGGGSFLHPSTASVLINDYKTRDPAQDSRQQLTPRERKVLKLMTDGQSSRDIADTLFITLKTVAVHRSHIIAKMGFHNRADLIKYALKMGLEGRTTSR